MELLTVALQIWPQHLEVHTHLNVTCPNSASFCLFLVDSLSQQKLPPSPPSQTKDPKPILVRSVPFILIPCPALVGYPCGLLLVSIYLLSLYPQSLERQASLPTDLSSSFFFCPFLKYSLPFSHRDLYKMQVSFHHFLLKTPQRCPVVPKIKPNSFKKNFMVLLVLWSLLAAPALHPSCLISHSLVLEDTTLFLLNRRLGWLLYLKLLKSALPAWWL